VALRKPSGRGRLETRAASGTRAPASYVVAEVDGRRLRLSNLDKTLWPRAGFTKAAMLEYYSRVAPVLLPHLAGRPCTLGRFPDGVEGVAWFQTTCRGSPAWLSTADIVGANGALQRYCVLDNLPSLVWAANQGAIELHPFLARASELERPLAVVFDLDPGPPATLRDCAEVAVVLGEALRSLPLESFVKTSGWSGMHVVVPLNTPAGYAATKVFARGVADELAHAHADRIVSRNPKPLRAGKVLIDWAQNARLRSTVAPYSLRGTELPVVSTPVTWDEVRAAATAGDERGLVFGPDEVLARLERSGDLFAPVLELEQRLT
jgi:bifunctional non-homologous end joining protein LigD